VPLTEREEKGLFDTHTSVKFERPDRPFIANVFKQVLRGKSVEEIAAMLTNPARNATEYLQLVSNGKTCQRMSLLYNPHRLAVRSGGFKSIYEGMQADNFYSGLGRVWLADMYNNASPDVLYSMVQANINATQYTNEFPPHVARDIYREFSLDRRSRILDPCAGWGGRMIGASVVSNH
jgi:hypothetical protein